MRDNWIDSSWIGDWSGRRALLTPNRIAIIDKIDNKSYTFADMNTRANQLAHALSEANIGLGDRVAMFAKNRIECVDLFLATGKI